MRDNNLFQLGEVLTVSSIYICYVNASICKKPSTQILMVSEAPDIRMSHLCLEGCLFLYLSEDLQNGACSLAP